MKPAELRYWREVHGLSLRQLAALLGVTHSAIAHWENPDNPNPPPHWLTWALPAIEAELKGEKRAGD
jgi:transcriptional regulator with XRE-family HTH domain